ncbi:hypothetical protein [Streptacidiphilus jiangxiensis]|uniref:Uncharacterized protein n=1 Tax=Streptacidiphilus jiangxiensis TaxID=235985 RepID=A0A1H8AIC0_STRJI|nr:hypothetical protein [Streptacidiphilus jiangxiensis]SEM70283.1 hypothetical protein SAMN05414137_14528 [Streptacidiphilus jiangxiensis]
MAPSRDDLPLWLVTIPFHHLSGHHKGEQTFLVPAATADDAREEAWRQAQLPISLRHRRGAALIPTGPLLLHTEWIHD